MRGWCFTVATRFFCPALRRIVGNATESEAAMDTLGPDAADIPGPIRLAYVRISSLAACPAPANEWLKADTMYPLEW